MLTLKQWTEKAGVHSTHPTTEKGAVSVCVDERNPLYSKLWMLRDYRVSSVCGCVVWMVPSAIYNPDPDQGKRAGFDDAVNRDYERFCGLYPGAGRSERLDALRKIRDYQALFHPPTAV